MSEFSLREEDPPVAVGALPLPEDSRQAAALAWLATEGWAQHMLVHRDCWSDERALCVYGRMHAQASRPSRG